MTDSTTEPMNDQADAKGSATAESALRKSLIFLIFFMLPVIGLLVFLVIRQRVDQAVEAGPVTPATQQVDESALAPLPITDSPNE